MALDPNIGRIKFLRSKTAGLTPTTADIDEGELALNLVDRTIYTRNGNNIIDMGFGKGGQVNGNITASGTVKATKLEGPLTGNAASATSLQYARTINGVAFNGTANITLPVFEKTSSVNESYNLNNRNLSGVHTEYTWKNAPAGGVSIGGVLAINYSPDWQAQLFFNMNTGNPQIYARNFTSGTTWGSWKQLAFTDGNISGNAASATTLQTSRTIGISGASGASGSVSFDGTGNALIPLSVITQPTATNNLTIATTAFVQAVNSADTGSAATALALKTARTINGVSFNGTANITIADNTKLPLTGGTLTGGLTAPTITSTGTVKATTCGVTGMGGYSPSAQGAYLSWNRNDGGGRTDFINHRGGGGGGFDWWNGDESSYTQVMSLDQSGVLSTIGGFSGNAATATKLQTARTINGVSFDGTANITIADNTKLPLTGGTINGSITTTNLSVRSGVINSDDSYHYIDIGKASVDRMNFGSYGGIFNFYNTNGPTIGVSIANNKVKATTFEGALAGNAATANTLATARKINGVSFDGSTNITIADNTKLPLSGGTITGSLNVSDTITVTNVGDQANAFKKLIQATTDGGYLAVGNNATDKGYVEIGTVDDADTEIYASQRTSANAVTRRAKLLDGAGNTSFPGTVTAPTFSGALSGNATTASSLATARTINGVAFNGTTDIQIDAIRVGTISWHLGNRSSVFTGDLVCDGQVLNRADYPELWNMVNAGRFASVTDAVWLSDVSKRGAYSTGNGSTTFRLPDLNGGQAGSIPDLFLRGTKATNAGTVLDDAIRNITGAFGTIADQYSSSSASGSFEKIEGEYSQWIGHSNGATGNLGSFSFNASRVVPTADENRPKSVFGIWVVSAKGSNVVVPGGSTAATITGGNTFQGSQTINGDLVVKQNVKVEGITTDRFGFYDKMYWAGAISRPNAQNVLVTPLDGNRFTAYFTLNSGSQYINFGTSKIHMIQNWGSPTPKYIQATIDSSVDANAGKQVITLTCTLPNHGILAATNFYWIAITYESFGCEIDQYIANGDMRYVSRLKSDSAFSSKSPIVTISSSSSEWFSGTQSGTGSPEIHPTASSSAPIVAAVSGQHISFVGVGGIQVPYVTISVKDRII